VPNGGHLVFARSTPANARRPLVVGNNLVLGVTPKTVVRAPTRENVVAFSSPTF